MSDFASCDCRHSLNFLKNHNLAVALLQRTTITYMDLVVEIGPGRGILTHQLAQNRRQRIASTNNS